MSSGLWLPACYHYTVNPELMPTSSTKTKAQPNVVDSKLVTWDFPSELFWVLDNSDVFSQKTENTN